MTKKSKYGLRKRRPYKRRAMASKLVKISRRITGHNIHAFERTISGATDVKDWSALQNYSFTFKLADLPDYTEFTNLFDAYRITSVKLKFIYSCTEVTGPSSVNAMPQIFMVNDYDDATPLASYTAYQEYETFRIKRLDKPFKTVCKPRVAMALYAGAFTSYG